MEKLIIVILAAGKGTRMGGNLPKVLTKTSRGSLISSVIDSANSLNPEKLIVVVGYKGDLVKEHLNHYSNITFATQEEQLGTGHAVKIALEQIHDFTGKILILYGDVPLVSESTLLDFNKQHDDSNSTISVITFNAPTNIHKYGRIIKENNNFVAIREHVDCNPEEIKINECNSGIYLIHSSFLIPAVKELKNDNKQKEYYLTDIIERATNEGQKVSTYLINDYVEVLGVNTLLELSQINEEIRKKKINSLILEGVIFENPYSCVIDSSVSIGSGTVIGSNCTIKGNTNIESNVVIEGTCFIQDSYISEGCHIKLSSRIEKSKLGKSCSVGPCAHLRPESILGEEVKIGNFVETKKTKLSNGSKVSHLTYLGDCEVGTETNIGAGVITCNYDGINKFKTIIGNNVFIGSNSSLVAPIKIEDNALIGAGSVITKNVISNSLALTRAPLITKENYLRKKKI